MLTIEEKNKIVRMMDANDLMECFIMHGRMFNPVDDDKCESYEVLKSEIIRRMNGYAKIIDTAEASKQ